MYLSIFTFPFIIDYVADRFLTCKHSSSNYLWHWRLSDQKKPYFEGRQKSTSQELQYFIVHEEKQIHTIYSISWKVAIFYMLQSIGSRNTAYLTLNSYFMFLKLVLKSIKGMLYVKNVDKNLYHYTHVYTVLRGWTNL